MDLFWETYFQASSPFPFSFASPLVASRWRRQSSCHLIVEGKGCLIFVHAVFLHRLLLISTWDDIFLIGLWTSSSSWNLWEFFLYGLVWVSMAPGELSCFLCVELPETRLSLHFGQWFWGSNSEHLLWDSHTPHVAFSWLTHSDTLWDSHSIPWQPLSLSHDIWRPWERRDGLGQVLSHSLHHLTPFLLWFRSKAL